MDPLPTIAEWIAESLPILLSHKAKRIDGETEEGPVSAYWVGYVIRIDLKAE
jgi:hypothetical protein